MAILSILKPKSKIVNSIAGGIGLTDTQQEAVSYSFYVEDYVNRENENTNFFNQLPFKPKKSSESKMKIISITQAIEVRNIIGKQIAAMPLFNERTTFSVLNFLNIQTKQRKRPEDKLNFARTGTRHPKL